MRQLVSNGQAVRVKRDQTFVALGLPRPVALPQPADTAGLVPSRRTRLLARVERDSVYRRSLAVADACAAIGALLAAIIAARGNPVPLATFATVPLIVVMSKLIGTYDREDLLVRKSSLDEVPELFQLATVYALSTWLISHLTMAGTQDAGALLIIWVAVLLLLVLLRRLARVFSRATTLPERCLVIGDESAHRSLERKFARQRSLHAVVVGKLGLDGLRDAGENGALLARAALEEVSSRLGVDRVIVMSGVADDEGVSDFVRTATALGLKVSLLPTVLEAVGSSVKFDDVEGMPLLSMRPLALSRSSSLVKRIVDLVGATGALLVLSPLLAIAALAIKLTSPGPVLFRQCRVGQDGKHFWMLKFRTMVADAEQQKHKLHHLNEADGVFKIAADPRITRVGRWLRRSSLDELPQLLNVLRGEMSIVGPRPLIPEEDRRVLGWHRRRLHLKPGMTGHWQILGSARIPLDEMVRIDYLYVTNWSLWLDVKILLRTVPYTLAGQNL